LLINDFKPVYLDLVNHFRRGANINKATNINKPPQNSMYT